MNVTDGKSNLLNTYKKTIAIKGVVLTNAIFCTETEQNNNDNISNKVEDPILR